MPNNAVHPIQYIQTSNPETVNDATPYAPGQVGAEIVIKQPGPLSTPGAESGREHRYKYVQTDSTMTTTPYAGAVAWWADATAYKVTTNPASLGRGRVAGVFQNAITAGYYGYIQIGGPATVKFVDAPTAAPTAAGLIVIPSATAGKADCLGAGTAASYPALGKSASAYNDVECTAVVELDVPHGRP